MKGPIPESLRLFILAANMQWNHLPVGGGIYDQDPRLIEDWEYIFNEQAKREDLKARKHKAEMDRLNRK